MTSRNEWLTQRMEQGAGLRREAEEKARRCEVSALHLKMRVALFQHCTCYAIAQPAVLAAAPSLSTVLAVMRSQRVAGPESQHHIEPSIDPQAARREAIARER
eukprot:3756244-Prymnesium_polylepis.1